MSDSTAAESSGIESRLLSWLDSQGYPLELKTAQIMRQHGATVIQSQYYVDPEEEKSREIDLLATWVKFEENHLARITLAIECKKSHDKPWIVFAAPGNLAGPARVTQRAATDSGHAFLEAMSHETEAQNLPLMKLQGQRGYGVTQAFTSSSDSAYQAVLGAAKATQSESTRFNDSRAVMEIVFPVVVVGGRLFECSLDDDGKLQLQERDRCVLAWRRGLVDVHDLIHIVTEAGLSSFAADAKISAEALIQGAFANEFWKL